jgi:hypothetical protein
MSLTITVYENGVQVPISTYTQEELDSLIDAIEELWSPTFHSNRVFCVDYDGEDALVLVYRDTAADKDLPIPEAWMKKTVRFGVKNDLKLVGDRIPITPDQYWSAPWSPDIKVQFHPE